MNKLSFTLIFANISYYTSVGHLYVKKLALFITLIANHKIILGTVPGEKATSTVMDGLAVNGKIIIIDASDEPLELYPNSFFFDYRSAVVG